ncbi:MAG: hypothetical protein M3063_11465 [Actinomycetota bacterium]|nr:hypothetical protein [Actinomycetota bacterium]
MAKHQHTRNDYGSNGDLDESAGHRTSYTQPECCVAHPFGHPDVENRQGVVGVAITGMCTSGHYEPRVSGERSFTDVAHDPTTAAHGAYPDHAKG